MPVHQQHERPEWQLQQQQREYESADRTDEIEKYLEESPKAERLAGEQESHLAQEKSGNPLNVNQKAYEFAFAGDRKAQLKIIGDFTLEDITDLESYLMTTLTGLKRSAVQAK